MPIEEILRTRAAAGAEFLDLHDPGWVKKITRKIRVASTHDCPLAQLYGRYKSGVDRYKLSEVNTLGYGFRADSRELGKNHGEFKRYYSLLNEAWEVEVLKRK